MWEAPDLNQGSLYGGALPISWGLTWFDSGHSAGIVGLVLEVWWAVGGVVVIPDKYRNVTPCQTRKDKQPGKIAKRLPILRQFGRFGFSNRAKRIAILRQFGRFGFSNRAKRLPIPRQFGRFGFSNIAKRIPISRQFDGFGFSNIAKSYQFQDSLTDSHSQI